MTVESLGDYLKKFFNASKDALNENYPGISLRRLQEDLKLFISIHGKDADELFQLAYEPNEHHPATIFFNSLDKGIPLEYITGLAYFYKSQFKVTNDVLIPRSETEILVEIATNEIKKNYNDRPCRMLDLGTGSGAIVLSVLMDCQGKIDAVASDISDKALNIAKENYLNLRFAISDNHSLEFVQSDRFQNITGQFDVILTNPPYIKKVADLNEVHHQVNKFEPHLALYIEDSNYDLWFKDLFIGIWDHLTVDGLVLIEGHENHLEHLKNMAIEMGMTNTTIIKDYTDRNRFLQIKR